MNKLLEKLLNRIEKYEYPANPISREKKGMRLKNYVFISTKFFEHKDEQTGVVSLRKVAFTYKRKEKKHPSKRDIHRKGN